MSTASRICLAHLSWDILFTWPNRINVAEICLVGEVARSSGFYKFHRCAFVAKCHTVNSSKNFQLPLVLEKSLFQPLLKTVLEILLFQSLLKIHDHM